MGKKSLGFLPNQPPNLLRFGVIRIVIVGTKHKRAQQNPLAHFLPKPFGAALFVEGNQVGSIGCPVTIAHPIEPRQVGTGLSSGQNIIGWQKRFEQRQTYGFHGMANRPECVDFALGSLADAHVHAFTLNPVAEVGNTKGLVVR